MNIKSIKERASQSIMSCKPQLVRILMIVMLIGLIPDLFPTSNNLFGNLLSIIISLLFLTWEHGTVVSTLKVVRNSGHTLCDDDAFVGFRRIKDLFTTYFVSSLVKIVVNYLVAYILLMIFGTLVSYYVNVSLLVSLMTSMSSDAISYLVYLVAQSPSLLLFMFLVICIIIVVSLVISCYVFPMPYLKEQYHMTATQSLKESFSLMSGHVFQLIKLELSFLGWIILTTVIQLIVVEVLFFMPLLGTIIGGIVSTIFAVYTYLPRYKVSQAVFFEELAYYRYDYNQGDAYGE